MKKSLSLHCQVMIIVTSIISFGRDLITDWLYRHITDDEI